MDVHWNDRPEWRFEDCRVDVLAEYMYAFGVPDNANTQEADADSRILEANAESYDALDYEEEDDEYIGLGRPADEGPRGSAV